MADSVVIPMSSPVPLKSSAVDARRDIVVRLTHWLFTLAFFALLVTGIEILISHPRFYWGEDGSVMTPALFKLPIPASRSSFPTAYGYVLPDQNGWSRYLHFQAAWLAVIVGFVYVAFSLLSGHFKRNLLPSRKELDWPQIWAVFANHLRLKPSPPTTYNVLQKLTYVAVVFILFPLVVWTGLAMSPAIASAAPAVVTVFGGQQSARTIHFFVSISLVLFLITHVAMVSLSGFRQRIKAMVIGRNSIDQV